jgi:putative hydrolase of the HAD superfamily
VASGIAAVVLDFGGVLWNMRWDVARALEDAHGLPRRALAETLYDTQTWRDLQCGRGARAAWLEESHRLLEARGGRPLPRLHDEWRASQHLIAETVALVGTLRSRYRTAILSNSDAALPGRLRESDIDGLFDVVICSAEVGLAKPDPAIYRLAADRLGLTPGACVFVDDAEPNVAAAETVGMRAIHFRVDRGDDLAALLARHGVPAPARETISREAPSQPP